MRKWHRWLSVIFGVILLWVAVTGVMSQVAALVAEGQPQAQSAPPAGFACPEGWTCRPKPDPNGARAWVAKNFAIYGTLPSYRAMLDREGAAGPADVTLAGDEKTLDRELARLRELGVSDFAGAIAAVDVDTAKRTLAYLASRA